MKKLKKENLKAEIVKPENSPKDLKSQTVAEFILYLFENTQFEWKRPQLKSADKVEKAFENIENDTNAYVVLDDADHKFLVDFVDAARIISRPVYKQVTRALDEVEE